MSKKPAQTRLVAVILRVPKRTTLPQVYDRVCADLWKVSKPQDKMILEIPFVEDYYHHA